VLPLKVFLQSVLHGMALNEVVALAYVFTKALYIHASSFVFLPAPGGRSVDRDTLIKDKDSDFFKKVNPF
jgi:hypothetical protein